MHQRGRKRFVSDRNSYLKDFNFQVNFTILSAPFFLLGGRRIKGIREEKYPLHL